MGVGVAQSLAVGQSVRNDYKILKISQHNRHLPDKCESVKPLFGKHQVRFLLPLLRHLHFQGLNPSITVKSLA